MRTVRTKLVAIVLAGIAPAIVAAVVRAREAEDDLLAEASRRIDDADDALNAQLGETETCIMMMLQTAAQDKSLDTRHALSERAAGMRYLGASFVVLDNEGERISRLVKVGLHWSWALGISVGKLGALVAYVPLDEWLGQAEKQLAAKYALHIRGETIGAQHPSGEWPKDDGVVLHEARDRFVAVNTFTLPALQGVSASAIEDITQLRHEIRNSMWRTLAVLAAVLLVALTLALVTARRMVLAVAAISDAAKAVSAGRYVDARVVRTGDELQQLSVSFNHMVQGLRDRDRLRDTFGRYVTGKSPIIC